MAITKNEEMDWRIAVLLFLVFFIATLIVMTTMAPVQVQRPEEPPNVCYVDEQCPQNNICYDNACLDLNCVAYCEKQIHIMCVGHWKISGRYPNCQCVWVCEGEIF